MRLLLIVISISSFDFERADGRTYSPAWFSYWGERGQDHWCCNGAPLCCGNFQSPINIDTRFVAYDKDAQCLTLFYYNVLPQSFAMHNTGLGVELIYNGLNASVVPFVLYKGYRFVLDRIYFHWGSQNSHGSEHTLNFVKMPLEMQLFHRNTQYRTMAEARTKPGGLLAIAVFFQMRAMDNDNLRNVIYNLNQIKWYGQHMCMEPFPLVKLLPPSYGFYYAYLGSLTQPPCHESVLWIVFHNPVCISDYQMNEFRKLQTKTRKMCPDGNCYMVDNYRMPLCVRSRQVFWKEECPGLTSCR